MPPTERPEQLKIDPRIYFAILFFRWKLIVVCFLYCLLGGVLYLELSPREYVSNCQLMIYRDPTLSVTGQGYQWRSLSMHHKLLTGTRLNQRVVQKLYPQWAKTIGNPAYMWPIVRVGIMGHLSTLDISVRSQNRAYGEAYLSALVDEFRKELASVQKESYENAMEVLSEQLGRLDERIRSAEDDVIEFERLHQMAYVSAKGSLEKRYLEALMARRSQLSTEVMLLEAQFPRLKGEDVFVLDAADRLTRETGSVGPVQAEDTGTGRSAETPSASVPGTIQSKPSPEDVQKRAEELGLWQELRVEMLRLQQKEKELTQTLRPEHPEVQTVRKRIADIQEKLDFSAEVELDRLKARRKALLIQMDAMGTAERRWQDSYLLASKKLSELRHLQMVVTRFESMYQNLYSRLSDLRIDQELKSEHFIMLEPIRAAQKPVWPDPFKILFAALVAGLGSGLGLALLTHVLDNKVQSIADVESVIGIPFLGGIPFWVHSGLDSRIRPIVSEEHATGAAEAYRALRTNVLAAVEKAGQKIVLLTSADSKEGKTLTVLNLAIMIARTGRKVLLLDMDLRRGVLHKSFEIERSPGITDALRDGRPLRDVTAKTSHENLWFAPAGTSMRETAELLHSSDLRAFLAEARDQYDVILMDSAPVLRVTDTVILADRHLCSVIYVAHANKTPKPMIRYSIEMLEDANVLGLIVNSLEMHKISSLYYAYQYPNYAYYSYAYAYGYDYYFDEGGRPKHRHRHAGTWEARRRAAARWLRRTFLPME